MPHAPEKLSTVASHQSPFFGEKTTFSRAFPRVAKIRFTIHEHSIKAKYDPEEYDETNLPEDIVDCRNRSCHGGGVRIQQALQEIFSELGGRNEFEKAFSCPGHEGTRTKSRGPCFNAFVIKGHVEFKPSL